MERRQVLLTFCASYADNFYPFCPIPTIIMNEKRTLIDANALLATGDDYGFDIGYQILEYHMEGDTKVVDKVNLIEVSWCKGGIPTHKKISKPL